MPYTLEGFNPTLFGFLSGILSVLGQAILLHAVNQTYGMLINWHLSQGFQLPASMFGSIPPNFVGALSRVFLKHPQISVPVSALWNIF
jgi:hypothetical protein